MSNIYLFLADSKSKFARFFFRFLEEEKQLLYDMNVAGSDCDSLGKCQGISVA